MTFSSMKANYAKINWAGMGARARQYAKAASGAGRDGFAATRAAGSMPSRYYLGAAAGAGAAAGIVGNSVSGGDHPLRSGAYGAVAGAAGGLALWNRAGLRSGFGAARQTFGKML